MDGATESRMLALDIKSEIRATECVSNAEAQMLCHN